MHFCLGEIPERTSGETRATRSIFLERVRFAPTGHTIIRPNDRTDDRPSKNLSFFLRVPDDKLDRSRPIVHRLAYHDINHRYQTITLALSILQSQLRTRGLEENFL